MNDQLKAAQKRVEETTARLEKKLGLNEWWRIKHTFSETPDGAEALPLDGRPSVHRTTACTVSQWEYRSCEITWYLPSVAIIDDDYLEWVAIHEYIHMLNAPLASFLFDYLRDDESAIEQLRTIGQYSRLEEYVTESVARLVLLSLGKDIPA
jgi:hypothetical protein